MLLSCVKDVINTWDFYSFGLFVFILLVLSSRMSMSPEKLSSQCLFQVEQFHYSLCADFFEAATKKSLKQVKCQTLLKSVEE